MRHFSQSSGNLRKYHAGVGLCLAGWQQCVSPSQHIRSLSGHIVDLAVVQTADFNLHARVAGICDVKLTSIRFDFYYNFLTGNWQPCLPVPVTARYPHTTKWLR